MTTHNQSRRQFAVNVVSTLPAVLMGCGYSSQAKSLRAGFFTPPIPTMENNVKKLHAAISRRLRQKISVSVTAVPCDKPGWVSAEQCYGFDILVAATASLAAALRRAAPTSPIVFASGPDPRDEGLVESYSRPGQAATGFTYYAAADGARVEMLLQCVPQARRIGVIVDPWIAQHQKYLDHTQKAIHGFDRAMSLEVCHTTDALVGCITRLSTAKADALLFPMSSAIEGNENAAADAAVRLRIPAMYPYAHCVSRGGLFSYEATIYDPFEILARQCAAIFAGASASEIPIETPEIFALALNFDAARKIGLRFPDQLVRRADHYFGVRGT